VECNLVRGSSTRKRGKRRPLGTPAHNACRCAMSGVIRSHTTRDHVHGSRTVFSGATPGIDCGGLSSKGTASVVSSHSTMAMA
jgi:hypothetical protein